MTRFDVTQYARETVQLPRQETPYFMSPDRCPPNSLVDYRICRLMQERAYVTQTSIRDTSDLKQRLIDTCMGRDRPIAKRHRQSSWSMEKAATCKHEGKMTSLWTSAKLKPALFRAKTLRHYITGSFPSRQQSTKENTLFRLIYITSN